MGRHLMYYAWSSWSSLVFMEVYLMELVQLRPIICKGCTREIKDATAKPISTGPKLPFSPDAAKIQVKSELLTRVIKPDRTDAKPKRRPKCLRGKT